MIGEDLPCSLQNGLDLIVVVAYELRTRHRVLTLVDGVMDLLVVAILRRLLKERILQLSERYI